MDFPECPLEKVSAGQGQQTAVTDKPPRLPKAKKERRLQRPATASQIGQSTTNNIMFSSVQSLAAPSHAHRHDDLYNIMSFNAAPMKHPVV
jgi:hypothetical protein